MLRLVLLTLFSAISISAVCCPDGFIGYLPNPYDCHTFVGCPPSGIAVKMSCPERDLCWYDSLERCNACKDAKGCPSSSYIPLKGNKDNFTGFPDVPVFMAYPKDCSTFYFCGETGTFAGNFSCAHGLWFNFKEQKCTEPWSYKCYY